MLQLSKDHTEFNKFQDYYKQTQQSLSKHTESVLDRGTELDQSQTKLKDDTFMNMRNKKTIMWDTESSNKDLLSDYQLFKQM